MEILLKVSPDLWCSLTTNMILMSQRKMRMMKMRILRFGSLNSHKTLRPMSSMLPNFKLKFSHIINLLGIILWFNPYTSNLCYSLEIFCYLAQSSITEWFNLYISYLDSLGLGQGFLLATTWYQTCSIKIVPRKMCMSLKKFQKIFQNIQSRHSFCVSLGRSRRKILP